MGFWEEDCPARGVMLKHRHATTCEPARGPHPGLTARHAWTDCCHCGQSAADYNPPRSLPSVDLEARLNGRLEESDDDIRQRDFILREADLAPEHLLDPDSVPREPKMATIGEPVYGGVPWGRGRSWRGDGWLSPRDKARLIYHCDIEPRTEVPE